MKKIKIKIKGCLLVKIAKYRKEIKALKNKIIENALREQNYIDEINIMQDDIRQLILLLTKEQRELWYQKKGKKYERYTPKKK